MAGPSAGAQGGRFFSTAVEKQFCSCRDVLWYLVFCGFAVNYMLETNVSLTIIAIVIPRPVVVIGAQCNPDVPYAQTTSNLSNLGASASTETNYNAHNLTQKSPTSLKLARTLENTSWITPAQHTDRFDWNEYEQSLVLGAFCWLHWITHLPGGFLARHYGTKLIFGWANLLTALLGFLTPFCVRYHLYAFVALRVVQGFISGFAWPSMHNMTAKWIPLNERSTFISSYIGSSVGAAISFPIYTMLINWLGWDSVFYFTSTLGVLWYISWYHWAYDTPQEHPRISEAEKNHILKNLGDSIDHSSSKLVPWRAILTSGPLWLTVMGHCGANLGLLTVMAEAPSYFTYMHGWNINTTGVLSAGPHVVRMLFSYVFSSFADWVLRTKRLSTTNLRKFAIFVSNGIQGIMLLGMAFSGCQPNLAMILMILGIAASGSITAGTFSSCIDLAPNYGSILFGICNIFSTVDGFLGPLLVGILTNNNQTIEQWKLVYLITAAITSITGIPYIFFGSSDQQPWNDARVEKEVEVELEKLRPNATVESNVMELSS